MSNVKQQAAVDTQIYFSKCSNGSSKIFSDNKYNNINQLEKLEVARSAYL